MGKIRGKLTKHSKGTKQSASESAEVKALNGPSTPGDKDTWFPYRLVILLVLLGFLAFFGGQKIIRDTLLARAKESIRSLRDSEGLDHLRNFEKRFGKTGEVEFLRARAFRHLSDTERAEQQLDFAKQLKFNPAAIRNEKTLIDAQNGQLVDSEKSFMDLMGEPGMEVEEVFSAFCMGSLVRMRFEDVFKLVGLWMKEVPSSGAPYVYLGMLAQYKYQWQSAEEAFTTALEKKPGLPPALLGLAETKRRLNLYQDASPLYRQFLVAQPASVEAKIGLAESLLGSQRSDEAKVLLEESIADGQKSFELRLMLGRAQFDLGEYENAMKTLVPLRELWPEDIDLTYTLARVYAQLGQDANAEPLFVKTEEYRALLKDIDLKVMRAEREPNNVELLFELGHLHLHHVSREEGRVWLQAAMQLDGRHIPTHQDLEKYYIQTGDQAMAGVHRNIIQKLGGTPASPPGTPKLSPVGATQ